MNLKESQLTQRTKCETAKENRVRNTQRVPRQYD